MNIKPKEIIENEFLTFENLDIHTLHLNDPNFGILKERDFDLAQKMVYLFHQKA